VYAGGIAGLNFPLTKEIQSSPVCGNNLIMMVLDENYDIEFSSYFGTGAGITPYSIENHQDQMIVVGRACENCIPVSDDAVYSTNSGDDDGFLMIFDVESYLANYIEPFTITIATDLFYLMSFLSVISVLIFKSAKIRRN
jgi:hypothetical protein